MLDNFDNTITTAAPTAESGTSMAPFPYVTQTEYGSKKKLTKKLKAVKKERDQFKKERDQSKKKLKAVKKERDLLLYNNGALTRDSDMMKRIFALVATGNRKQANADVAASALLDLPPAK